jgi:cytidine deaminase
MPISSSQIESLRQRAISASKHAYCPYSHFQVGAAVLTESGAIFSGCNVENASLGMTICAERNAIFQAIAAGRRKLLAIVIYTPTARPALSCGACRQVICEFDRQVPIYSFCDGPEHLSTTIAELLPLPFRADNLTAS